MQGGLLKLVAGALVIGALMVFAALQLIGTEDNMGRLAQMADRPPMPEGANAPDSAPMPQPAPMAEPMPEQEAESDDWFGEDSAVQGFAPEPFDPSPQFDDLPPEDLRFAPRPEPGVGQPSMPAPAGEFPQE